MTNEEKKKKIREWQSSGFVHPLTCGNDNCRYKLRPIEKDGKVVLSCLVCDYIQEFIPEVIFSTDVKKLEEDIEKWKGSNEDSTSTD